MATKKRPRRTDDAAPNKRQQGSDDPGEYVAWLRARGVRWDEGSILTSTEGCVAGWGCLAQKKFRKGGTGFKPEQGARHLRNISGTTNAVDWATLGPHLPAQRPVAEHLAAQVFPLLGLSKWSAQLTTD